MSDRKSSSTKTSIDSSPAARAARQQRFMQHLSGLSEALSIEEPVTAAQNGTTNRKYGSDLSPVSRAAADAMDQCGEPFAGLPFTSATLRSEEERMRELQAARDSLARVLERVQVEHRNATGRLTWYTDQVLATVTMTVQNPATDAKLRRELEVAAQPALSILDSRRAAIASSISDGLAASAEVKAARAAAEALRADAERLARENQKLRGEESLPRSVSTVPAPIPARAARRKSGRKTSR